MAQETVPTGVGVIGSTLPVTLEDKFVILPDHALMYIEGAIS